LLTRAGEKMLDELRVKDRFPDPKLPWGGRSPRVLTKAYKRFRLHLREGDIKEDFDNE